MSSIRTLRQIARCRFQRRTFATTATAAQSKPPKENVMFTDGFGSAPSGSNRPPVLPNFGNESTENDSYRDPAYGTQETNERQDDRIGAESTAKLSLFSKQSDKPLNRPKMRLANDFAESKIRRGSPWLTTKDVDMNSLAGIRPPCLVNVVAPPPSSSFPNKIDQQKEVGVAVFHEAMGRTIARVLDRDPYVKIDHRWFSERLSKALSRREQLFSAPFYRVLHGESDGIPGILMDSGPNSSPHLEPWLPLPCFIVFCFKRVRAVEDILEPDVIVFRHDSAQGSGNPEVFKGVCAESIEVQENGVTHLVDLLRGAGTGFEFAHRANRARIAALSREKRVLDLFCGTGGFGLHAAGTGASAVTFVDTRQEYLDLAQKSADVNGFGATTALTFMQRDASVFLEERIANVEVSNDRDQLFDVIVCDPPNLCRNPKPDQVMNACRQYEKLFLRCVKLLSPNGILFTSMNSPFLGRDNLHDSLRRAIHHSKKQGHIIFEGGADSDFPGLFAFPESQSMKTVAVCVD